MHEIKQHAGLASVESAALLSQTCIFLTCWPACRVDAKYPISRKLSVWLQSFWDISATNKQAYSKLTSRARGTVCPLFCPLKLKEAAFKFPKIAGAGGGPDAHDGDERAGKENEKFVFRPALKVKLELILIVRSGPALRADSDGGKEALQWQADGEWWRPYSVTSWP